MLHKTILVLATILTATTTEDVVCRRKTDTSVLVEKEDIFYFKTQPGRTYRPNSRCVVTYQKSPSCASMRFSCSKFSIKNKRSSCTKGDRMLVVVDGKAKRFCQKQPPNITTSEDLRVVFISNKRGQAAGAQCSIQCEDRAPGNTGPVSCPGCPTAIPVTPQMEKLGMFAASQPGFPTLSTPFCSKELEVEVLTASSQVVAGTNYFLTLGVSASSGENCNLATTFICSNIIVFRPLPFQCTGTASCDQLTQPEKIKCTEAPPPSPPPSCICPAVFAPVCAENGETFSNSCSALCQGLGTACEGECPC